jgi:hypothetical protein
MSGMSGWQIDIEAITERGMVSHRLVEKFKQQVAWAVQSAVGNGPTFCGEEQTPPPNDY